jgi:site-specific DNA-cytosine methylase
MLVIDLFCGAGGVLFGLEAVLVAVELVIESGVLSVEHVLKNVHG